MNTPMVLSPATPTELLQYILAYQTHPTTLLICSTRADFLSSLARDVQTQVPQQDESRCDDRDDRDNRDPGPAHLPSSLLAAPIYQVAVARHIRILFLPTVTHLRAYLAIFTPEDSKVPPPPLPRAKGVEATSASTSTSTSNRHRPPLLLAYGFLSQHRDTSEWSAQGIGTTAAALVEAASRHEFRAALVEPRDDGGHATFNALLSEPAPVLSGGARRDEGGWMGRTVEVRSVLARWFRFQIGQWDVK
ncbi:hypothetical protein ACRALDRAFT_2093097 [Sodiomyces alcalophilus JCM 7366]|uniref:uncharacterized protein n=1 Tax=Sodiomyces alcalophilus JCM 7366 TaxID=591952 RepID=UPI0039B510C4